ncbi:MAG: sigma-54-dependent Fis family transcriptional regulator [Deltaproteobacteria bacterium]|nr:sigma-54-dependent Fis family transcriptional regulator [Deltaproteobacteria bacterium]
MSNYEFILLVVDDDPLIHQALKACIQKPWKIIGFQDPQLIPEDFLFHAAFIDMHLIKNSSEAVGVSVIEKLHKRDPHIEIVAMSGDLNRDIMESCLLAGAQKFMAKPLSLEEVNSILEKIQAHWMIRNFDSESYERHLVHWIGTSQKSLQIKKQIAELKGEKKTILIEGETGTGKEVVAKLLHLQESERPFVAVNVSSITESLFESEMFGHLKGSFTGAENTKIGLAEAAHGGDLFLDEIEAMPLSFQVKMLRFLESGEIRKVGAKDTIKIQTRVIVASNKPLLTLIKEGSFREDLYYRISAQKIELPPLRERKEDILELANYFLENERPKRNKKLTNDGHQELMAYSWPGNVRELKRICEQLSLTSPLPLIRAIDIIPFLTPKYKQVQNPYLTNNLELDLTKLALGLDYLLKNSEKQIIQSCLKVSNDDIEGAAQILKISKSNLYKKIKDLEINTKEKP